MDDCLRGPSRKYSFKVEKMKTIDPIQSFVEFPRPRGPMRSTVGRKVPKLRPNNDDLANYDGIEVSVSVAIFVLVAFAARFAFLVLAPA